MANATKIARKIVDEIGFSKISKSLGLTDYDPLVVIMYHVAAGIERRGGTFDKPKARKVWLKAIEELQEDDSVTEHNSYIPCRYCNRMFEPVVEEDLLTLFLVWFKSMMPEDLLAIHRCPECRGRLKAKQIKSYEGDFHTPEPGSIQNDEEWADWLLRHSCF